MKARHGKDVKLIRFCEEVLAVYEKHNINDFIKWE